MVIPSDRVLQIQESNIVVQGVGIEIGVSVDFSHWVDVAPCQRGRSSKDCVGVPDRTILHVIRWSDNPMGTVDPHAADVVPRIVPNVSLMDELAESRILSSNNP